MIEASKNNTSSAIVRYGMVGGGSGAFIGEVHRKAIGIDGKATLTAGCFSRSMPLTLETGKALGVNKDRLYESYLEMAGAEAKREDGIDFVSIVTPNSSHFTIARAFLEQGINVVCDKPLTTNYEEALLLQELAKEKDLLFAVTYTYTGYPAVKQAREMIRNGEIGKIRFVNAEYPQEWLAEPVENDPSNKQAFWRTDPAQSGISNCVGDIGSHMENMISYVTGLEIDSLSARLDRMVEGRKLDDNAVIMLNYKGGAEGLYWSSQIAWGHDNDLSFRIYGTEGAISWRQENPNYLRIAKKGEHVKIASRGRDDFYNHPGSYVRLPSGHPEGYFEAFANLYSTYIDALSMKKNGTTPQGDQLDFPTALDGAKGVRFIEKCVESSEKKSAWVKFQEKKER
ncbi:Gfo/Idh/MocA family oxidoreductase [Oceanispirochaeta sp.]|jgi:predicted dehydrogenase|uniref:Gfo/Idh/MocA family protein n=1 Tax=Oceanispirochaeta sp. TaxID=2035350 RepID=UPI00262D5899|nr:Gfo/Idh/MocA family oxidoreductase [Oceanispirochaeta sp.]MDA3955407.1 Gfo/Idh/MocA family oxidoreductase [Oceanispirochaeta sp.]